MLDRRRKILFWLFYLLFAITILEGGARFASNHEGIFQWMIRGARDSTTWRLKWIRTHRDSDAPTNHASDRYDPLRGWVLTSHLKNAPMSGNNVLNSNSQGIRGTRDYEVGHSEKFRIMCIGDSFTFGDQVSDDETFPAFLQEEFSPCEVINLGVHGYGHDQILLHLQYLGLQFQPDIVILGYVSEDTERNLLSFRDYAKPYFSNSRGQLKINNTPVPTPEEVLRTERLQSRFIDLMTIAYFKIAERSGMMRKKRDTMTTRLLQELSAEIKAIYAIPLFVYIPVSYDIVRHDTRETREERFFSKFCETEGIDALNLRPVFLEEAAAGYPLATEGHWRRSGNRLIADRVARFLREKGLIKNRETAPAPETPIATP